MRQVIGLVALLGLAASEPPTERVVEPGATAPVTVAGIPLRLRISPGTPGLPLLSQAIVAQAGVKCGGLLCFGAAYKIGREQVNGRTALAQIGWGDAPPAKRRVGWLSAPHDLPGDGTIGPAGLPESVVRFVLGPSRAGERTVAMPIEDEGLLSQWGALRGVLTLGKDRIAVRFDPEHPRSLLTAAAGVAVARAQGGTLGEERGRQEILFGVERPFRVMTLARPLAVGPLALSTLGVREADGSGANTIPQEGDDPSEVVVTAKGKKTYMVLSLGADALARCSSLVFDKPAKQVRLTCA